MLWKWKLGVGMSELRVVDVGYSYPGAPPALEGISLTLRAGRRVAVVGANGAGKSTLLKLLAGLLVPGVGRIERCGFGVERGGGAAYLPQREEVDWTFPVTVRGVVEMGRHPHVGIWRRFSAGDHAAVDGALNATRMRALAGCRIDALSGGQQQRAFLARALAQETSVLLLDEPFSGLDRPMSEELSDVMRDLSGGGRLVVASHHDLESVPGRFDEVVLLNRRLVAAGAVGDVFTDANIRLALGMPAGGVST